MPYSQITNSTSPHHSTNTKEASKSHELSASVAYDDFNQSSPTQTSHLKTTNSMSDLHSIPRTQWVLHKLQIQQIISTFRTQTSLTLSSWYLESSNSLGCVIESLVEFAICATLRTQMSHLNTTNSEWKSSAYQCGLFNTTRWVLHILQIQQVIWTPRTQTSNLKTSNSMSDLHFTNSMKLQILQIQQVIWTQIQWVTSHYYEFNASSQYRQPMSRRNTMN